MLTGRQQPEDDHFRHACLPLEPAQAFRYAPLHLGAGFCRKPSISRRMSANNFLETAIPAIWKVTYRPWLTTVAPILASFSRNVVSDPCSASFGNADVSCGSI